MENGQESAQENAKLTRVDRVDDHTAAAAIKDNRQTATRIAPFRVILSPS
jgi:hypothetical protein